MFIGAHLGFDFNGAWLHIDMASPVHAGERATGYGVALLNALFGRFTQSEMLRQLSPLTSEEDLAQENNDENGHVQASKSKKMRKK